MVTVLREGGCEVRIYTDDHQPPHVHVEVGGSKIALNLDDEASIRKIIGRMKEGDIKKARSLVKKNRALLLQKWGDIHKS